MAGLTKIGLTLVMAASGIVFAAPDGAATGSCPAGTGSQRSAWRAAGVPGRVPGSWGGRLSHDGRYAAFVSYEGTLVAGDTDQQADVFRMDRATRQILRVSLATNGGDFREHA
jgi:hypothetical protein